VPVPPLAEQRRIVAKVDELMGLCNQLEANITTDGQIRSRLLEAVLHKALEPA
jgi:type I restriction enzyme S subunit